MQSIPQQQTQQQPTTTQQQTQSNQPMSIEESLLQGQPPGTVIKCVTAQVIQTEQGPRIVLQGLVGNDFTQQQLALVQQQVKQQLLKGLYTLRNHIYILFVNFRRRYNKPFQYKKGF